MRKKIFIFFMIVYVLILLTGCASEKEQIAGSDLFVNAELEQISWQVVSTEPEDYGIPPSYFSSSYDCDFTEYPLDKLIAYYLHSDGAGAEGSSSELYQRFMEAPNTVLIYFALIGDQEGRDNVDGRRTAVEELCEAIAAAHVFWYDNTTEFTDILEEYKQIYSSGQIADILAILQTEYDAAITRL